MARKPKAKPRGRPRMAKENRREKRSLRLPPALWKRIDAYGEMTATIEQGMTQWLDDIDRLEKQ